MVWIILGIAIWIPSVLLTHKVIGSKLLGYWQKVGVVTLLWTVPLIGPALGFAMLGSHEPSASSQNQPDIGDDLRRLSKGSRKDSSVQGG